MDRLQAITWQTIGQLLGRRGFVFILGLAALPVLLAALSHAVSVLVEGASPSSRAIFSTLVQSYYFPASIIVTMTLGAALIGEEVEGRTLPYLTTRPVPRPLIIVGKYLALLVVGLAVLPGSLIVTYVILQAPRGDGALLGNLGTLTAELWWVIMAVPAYGAAFTLIGTITRKTVNLAAAFVFLWEIPFSFLPLALRRLTIAHHLMSISPQSSKLNMLVDVLGKRTSVTASIVTLLLLTAIYLTLAAVIFRRKQYVLAP